MFIKSWLKSLQETIQARSTSPFTRRFIKRSARRSKNTPVAEALESRIVLSAATLTIGDASVVEGNPGDNVQLVFDVTLDNAISGPITVDYATSNGTAGDGTGGSDSDYVARTGTLTFAGTAGEVQQIKIDITEDSNVELDETLKVILSNLQAGGGDVTLVGTGTPPGGNPAVFVQGQVDISGFEVSSLNHQAVLGDLDGDGDLDAFVAVGATAGENDYGNADRVWINQGGSQGGIAGQFDVSPQKIGTRYSRDVALGDVDNDGDLDAYVATGFGPDKLWLNQSELGEGFEGKFIDSGESFNTDGSTLGVSLADVDGDGDLDAVSVGDRLKVWFNQSELGEGFEGKFEDSPSQDFPSPRTWGGVAVGDLDGDGDLDIFAANKYGNPNRVFTNQSELGGVYKGKFTDDADGNGEVDVLPGVTGARGQVVLGDVDGDDDLDAFVANSGAVGIESRLFINQGGSQNGTEGEFMDSGQSLGEKALGVSLGDLDGDGDLDAFLARASGNFGQPDTVWLNDGSGVFTSTQTLPTSYVGLNVSLGDLDDDGDLDAFVANYNTPNEVWINQGIPVPGVTATGTINNDDSDNTPPTSPVDNDSADNKVAEGAVAGTLVGITATANDAEGDTLVYSLTNNAGGRFVIDSGTGVVTVAVGGSALLNYEDATSHLITVQAEDPDGETSTATFTINVANAAPTAPADDDTTANTVNEGATGAVGIDVSSTDFNGTVGGGNVTYSLSDSAGGRFQIDSVTGVVTVANAALLNYEDAISHEITVVADDGSGTANATSSQVFTINVNNVNPTISVDDDGATNQVTENAVDGSPVGIDVSSTDPNGTANGGNVTFSLSNDAGGRFQIDASTGIVTVADGSLLDYETATSHDITVVASDGEGGTSSQSFTVDLLNQTATISGTVFVDADGDGLFDGGGETAIDNVIVELYSGDGTTLLDSDLTELGGAYAFVVDDEFGSYTIRETQPTGVDEGAAILGSAGGSVVTASEMQLTLEGTNATDYDFTESGQGVQAGDTAGIGFWQNKHGQALIKEGGLTLVNWLNANFGNIFGNTFTDGSGGDNASEVASFYKNEFFHQKLKGTPKVDAQFMATALATFFTSSDLSGGSVATNSGFNVTQWGIGLKVVNIGSNGLAFGVADNTDMTIMAILLATNGLTGASDSGGHSNVYDTNGDGILDDSEKALRMLAHNVFSSIIH